MSGLLVIIWLAIIVFLIASVWVVYTKAGQPGWAAIIPIYNIWVLLKIVGRPGWWLILYFIPFVNIVIIFVVNIDLAHSFGRGTGYGFGLVLLSFIFYPMLAWGEATYEGPAGPEGASTPQMSGYSQPAMPPPPPPAAAN